MKKMFPRKAFTLTELLVVLAVIALLATLLLPAAKLVMGRSQAAECVSNLKQLGQATALYAADNNDEIPYANYYNEVKTNWATKLAAYMQMELSPAEKLPAGPFRCPACPYLNYGGSWSQYGKNYFTNGQLGGATFQNPRTQNNRFAQVSNPSKYYYLSDSGTNDGIHSLREIGSGRTDLTMNMVRGIQARHQGKANVLFMDFHVEAVALQDIPAQVTYGVPPWCPKE